MGSKASSVGDVTLLTPFGYSSSSCGYCSPSGSRSSKAWSFKYGMQAPRMACQFYQDLIDRGWRRSGDYLYHPDNGRTCCPQYTIRLNVEAFKPSKKHRQVINRFNRYLSQGLKPGEEDEANSGDVDMVSGEAGGSGSSPARSRPSPNPKSTGKGRAKDKGKGRAAEYDFVSELRGYEHGFGQEGVHRFETQLVPAKATPETFELYKKYQVAVHKDRPEKVTMNGFSRFLCDSPLIETPIAYRKDLKPDRLPKTYGSYHLLYRVDGQLMGISVIDILPSCISSVYFIWDPDWAWASLGKWSAMREIALARDIRGAGAEDMKWVYMGYWIADCAKMRYKSEYSPSCLLDPRTHVFHPLTGALDKYLQTSKGYRPFTDILAPTTTTKSGTTPMGDGESDNSDSADEYERQASFPTPAPHGFAEPGEIGEDMIDDLLVVWRGRAMRNGGVPWVQPETIKNMMRELVAAVGEGSFALAGMDLEDIMNKAFVTL